MMKLDKEYQTVYLMEKDYLIKNGITPSFMKIVEGIKIYKFTKTPELFYCLAKFYEEMNKN